MKLLNVKLVAERQILDDAIFVRGMHDGGLAEAAQAMRILGLGQMAASGAMTENLARSSDFEPLGHGLFSFDAFGTSHKFNSKERSLYVVDALKQGEIKNKLVVPRAAIGERAPPWGRSSPATYYTALCSWT
jgi:hypothetical protein